MAIFDNFGKKVGKVANDAAAKSRELAEIARHSMAISDERANVRLLYRDIGEMYYREHRQDCPDNLKSFCEKIDLSLTRIQELENKIKHIKGVRLCAACGETCDRRAKFCPACGQLLPDEGSNSPEADDKRSAADE